MEQNDMDFEQMMGELAAMKTDLANRQANRFGSRPSTPRDADQQEPRRTRLTRAKTETRADTLLSVETAALDQTVSPNPSVLSPVSPVIKRSATAGASLRDPDSRLNPRHHRPTLDRTGATAESDRNEQPVPPAPPAPRMRIDAAIPEQSAPSEPEAAESTSNTNGNVESLGPLPGGLVRRESKRAMPVPLPPKSAQRSRSISHGSSRLTDTLVDENGERVSNGLDSSPATPLETSTAVFDGPVPPRKFLRPYPSSPSLSTAASNGQMMPSSPRVPARSNSRSYAKSPRAVPGSPSFPDPSTVQGPSSPFDHQQHPHQQQQYQQQHPRQQQQQQQYQQHQHQQYQYHHQQAPQSPMVPPRSRSASRSLSRSNTLTKSETKHDEFPFTATPSIAEDRETPLSPQEPPAQQTVPAQPQQHQEQSQQQQEQSQQQQEQSQHQQEQPQQQQEQSQHQQEQPQQQQEQEQEPVQPQPQQQQEQPQQQQEQEQEPVQPQPQQQQQQEPIESQQPQPQPQPQSELQPVDPQQQQQDDENKQQQTMVTSEEALQRGVANSPSGVGYIQKKSSNNSLGHGNEGNAAQHPLAPSLLPAHSIPSRQASAQGDNDGHDGRPTLRKQQSVDPAAMYRQHQQEAPMRDRLPSRHASERRPNRDRNPSGLTDAGESGRSREPSGAGGAQNESERGRKEGSSKGGMFAWVRSRSKSRDASHAKHTLDKSHPVPESTYPEYNPALIPSRGGSQRSKSLPRKASNQNFQADSDGWPPVPQAGLNGDSAASLHQRSKSTSKFNRNPPPFANSTGGPIDTSGAPPSLNISTNKHTMHHENMIRGMGMGSTPMTPAVLLTPQPSFPTTQSPLAAGGMRGMALAMMKDDNSPSSSEQQMQQRHAQLQQAQMQHLQQQQQRLAASVAGGNGSPPDSPAAGYQSSNAQQPPMSPAGATAGANSGAANQVTQRLVATRIYIQTEIDFKSVNLAPNSTALDALHMLQERGCFGQPGDGRYHDRWTIFEYSKEFLIERPLRDFEVILDVMKTWEADKDNKMICKSFPVRNELTAQEVVRLVGPAGQEGFVRPHGWVHLEIKKSKWVKRYLHITDTAVYHSKDAKFNGESMLCLLRNFDVYAVQVPRKKAPTKFGFALKSSDKVHLFETPEDDYIHYVCTDSGELLREWLAGLRAAKGMFMYHANPEMIREGQKHAAQLLSSSSASQDGLTRGNLTEEQLIDGATPTTDSKSAQDAFSPLFTLDPLLSAASSPLQSSVASQDLHAQPQHNTPAATSSFVPLSPATSPLKDTFQLAPPSQPFISLAQSLSSSSLLSSTSDSSNISSNNAQTTASTISQPDFSLGPDLSLSNPTDMLHANSSGLKNPFMAGSLLQQRVEAEKQEIESMKMQLKMREQAGVLGSRHMDSNNSNNDTALLSPGLLTAHYQQGGHGRGLSSTSSSTSISSSAATPAYPYQQQQKQQQTLLSQFSQPKFGGPGTLIEQGEVRAAQLSRSKSAGTGLLRPSNGVTSTISNTSSNGHRTRSRSRGPAEDRTAYGSRPISPSSPRSPDFAPPMPQGPLLQFADADAMIQPGLLLNRARSNKQQLQPSYSSNQLRPSASSRRPGAGQSHGSQGQSQSAGTRGRVKPLIDIRTGPDVIGPGLLTNGHNNYTTTSSSSHAHNIGSSRSPRRTKPLLEF